MNNEKGKEKAQANHNRLGQIANIAIKILGSFFEHARSPEENRFDKDQNRNDGQKIGKDLQHLLP
jgi:hypothetical protein